MKPAIIYLHGFASGPKSTKARFFAARLKEQNIDVYIPDLNGSNFEKLTLSSQLKIARGILDQVKVPIIFIGSSMGGLLSVLLSKEYRQTIGLILMAPGFGLPKRWQALLKDQGMETWKQDGFVEVFHYGLGRPCRLNYGFVDDVQKYQTDKLTVESPTLVFHGRKDETVPVGESEDFAALNGDFVKLHILDDGHELIEPLELIWSDSWQFMRQNKWY